MSGFKGWWRLNQPITSYHLLLILVTLVFCGSVTNNTLGYTGGGSVTYVDLQYINQYINHLTSLTLDMRVVVLSPVVLVTTITGMGPDTQLIVSTR